MQADSRAYNALCKKELAIPNLITYHELPMVDEAGKATFERWPMIVPADLAGGSVLQPWPFLNAEQARAILQRGWRPLFGSASDELWEIYSVEFGVPKPGPDAFPIQFFGDEVEIFDNHQWMCLNWSAETSPIHSDAKASRYLICVLPVASYLFRYLGQKKVVNLTLQECLKIVVRSFNDLTAAGLAAVTCVKGDWKFLVQALSSKFSASSNEICFKCCATKSLLCPYTDVSPDAAWRTQLRRETVWYERPALADLAHFSLRVITPDVLHTYHLGVGRDVVASILTVLLKGQQFLPGSSAPRQR